MRSYNLLWDRPRTLDDPELCPSRLPLSRSLYLHEALDSASGVVAILEMVRIINMLRDGLKRRIRFICFGVEADIFLWFDKLSGSAQ
jgi:hypothetical protein